MIDAIWIGLDAQARSAQMSGNVISYDFAHNFHLHPAETTVGDIADYFDELYGLPAYRRIQWDNAYLLSALRQNDDDGNDRDFLQGFLRDNDYLPAFVRWVGTKDANVIVVEGDGPILPVRLTGLDASHLGNEGWRRVMDLLEIFRQFGGRNSCKEEDAPHAGSVRLIYRYDLFDRYGDLTADVELPGAGLCLDGQFIPYTDVTLDAGTVYLAPLLGMSGLLKVDDYTDPKWSEPRLAIRNRVFAPVSQEQAEQLRAKLVGLAQGKAPGRVK